MSATVLLGHAVRQMLRGRRVVGLVVLAAAPALVASALAFFDPPTDLDRVGRDMIVFVVLGLVLPLICLFLGTAVLRDEFEAGTVVHLVTRPIPRSTVVVARLAGAILVAWVLGALSVLLVAAVFGGGVLSHVQQPLVLVLVAAPAYTSAFALVGALTKRAALVGLAYIIVWDTILAGIPTFMRSTTLAFWVRSLGYQQDRASTALRDATGGDPASAASAIVALVSVLVVAAWLSMVWFGRKEIAGPETET